MTTLIVTDVGRVEAIGYGPSTPKFNPVKLFNYVDAELVEEIPLWHPAFGQHTPAALESINIISDLDPARYNVSTLVTGNANYDPLRVWGAKEVGRVWFDTTNLEYVPYYDKFIFATPDERLSRWGALADYATMDVVEWVESSVPPPEYDQQSALDAGDADLDPHTKADGEAYGAKTYSRERTWKARPIAWSKAGVAIEAAHPSFNGSYNSTLNLGLDGLMWLETGTFEGYGIESGMHIGGWIQNNIQTLPVSEYLVTDEFTKKIVGDTSTVALSVSEHTDVVGDLLFTTQVIATPIFDADNIQTGTTYTTYLYANEVLSGNSDVVVVREDTSTTFTLGATQVFTYTFSTFGLQVSLTLPANTYDNTDTNNNPGNIIKNTLTAVTLYDAVRVVPVVGGSETTFSNDDSNVTGWRAWNVPTQDELDGDSVVPNSSWFPYVGEFADITPTIEIVQDAVKGASFMLNDGTVVERYKTDWSDWTELKSTTYRSTATIDGSVSFIVPSVSIDRISVYINGVAQLAGTYTLIGTTLTVLSVSQGSEVVVIVRAYTPTSTELAFDPDTADNLLIQRQYKVDYQYVEIPVRGEDGTITTTKYYFWVKNRSTAARKKTLSVKSIVSLLTTGPSQYLTFQNIQEA